MKQLFILLFILPFIGSTAQTVSENTRSLDYHHLILKSLLQQQNVIRAAAKPTSVTKYRLIAQSTRDNTLGSLNDSVDLKYSGLRNSSYDYNTMLFPYNYPYNTSPMFIYAGTFTKPQVLFDTMSHWQVDPNTLTYGYFQTDIAGYDANSSMTTYKSLHVDSSIYPNAIHANTFTTAKNISIGYTSNWIGGTADSAFKQYFTYNANNKLTADSTYELHLGAWHIVSRSYYTYDVSNNLTQIDCYENTTDTSFTQPLVEQLKYVNTYDASNRLNTVLTYVYNGTALEQYMKDTLAYAGAFVFHTSWKEYQWDPINSYWAPMFYMTKHLNSSNKPDTVNIQGFDSLLNSWVPQTMDVIGYNSNNDPDSLQEFDYNFTSFPSSPNFTTKYYYQSYVDNTGVNEHHTQSMVEVFPNPAISTITITGLVTQFTSTTVSLLNMNGQVLYRQTMPWYGEAQVSVHDLEPGIYIIVVQDEHGNVVHKQSILKP